MLFIFEKHNKPIQDKWIIRFLIVLTLILSIAAGYFHAVLVAEQKKYAKLEDLYVRVRTELGREETQRLIDFSREKEISN
ncbi:MAG: hypothetical protein BroJett025_05320 [Patescibacteria group bacterium]|nr:MAG: hypothetical protein BroJett025_05320 [Patescibacteria group bacterium]